MQLEQSFFGAALYPYKIPLGAKVENYLKIMLNLPVFPQLLALMWKNFPRVLVEKLCQVALEIRAVKILIFIFHY